MRGKKLVKFVALSAIWGIITLFSDAVFAQSREKVQEEIDVLWKKVEDSERKNLPASAISASQEIYRLAELNELYPDMVLAAGVIIRNTPRIDWNLKRAIIDEYAAKVDDFKDPVACAVFKSFMLQYLLKDFYSSKKPEVEKVINIKLKWYNDIIKISEHIKNEKWDRWLKVIEREDYMQHYINPSLYEYILVSILNSMNERDYFDYTINNPYDFTNIDLMNELKLKRDSLFRELFSYQSGNTENYLLTRYKQINLNGLFNSRFIKKENFINEFEEIVKQYKDYKNVTLFVREIATIKDNKLNVENIRDGTGANDSTARGYKELLEYCNHWMKRYPNSAGYSVLYHIKSIIIQKSAYITHHNQVYPGKEFEIKIVHRNIQEGKIKVYKVTNLSSLLVRNAELGWFFDYNPLLKTDAKLLSEYSIRFKNNFFAMYNRDFLKLTLKDEGVYIIEFEASESGVKNISRVFINKNVIVHDKKGDKYAFYAVDFESGKPLKEAEIVFSEYVRSAENNVPSKNRVVSAAKYSFDGFTKIDLPDINNSYNQILYSAGINGPQTNLLKIYNAVYNKGKTNIIDFFSDRTTYRPGDTIYFKIILSNRSNVFHVNRNDKITLNFKSPKGVILDTKTFESNEFGSVSGFFPIGYNSGTGSHAIEFLSVDGYNQYNSFLRPIIVEDKKRDAFYITTENPEANFRIGEEIIIRGAVKSYAGYPIKGVKISYTTHYELFRGYEFVGYCFDLFKASQTVTDSLGMFSVNLGVVTDSMLKKHNAKWIKCGIDIIATSVNSESNALKKHVAVGEVPLYISCYAPPTICAQRSYDFNIHLYGSDYNSKKPLKGHYKIINLVNDKKDEVLNGEFLTNTIFTPDLSGLKSGKYEIISSVIDEYGNILRSSSAFTLFHTSDKVLPDDNFYFYHCSDENSEVEKIEFFLGTSADSLFTEMVIYGGDSLLMRKALVTPRGLKHYIFEIPSKDSKTISFSATSVLKGKIFSHYKVFKIKPKKIHNYKLEISNLRKNYLPASNESLKIIIRDQYNKPVTDAELVVSIYDKSTELWKKNSFSPSTFRSQFIAHSFVLSSKSFSEAYGSYATLKENLVEEEEIPFMVGSNTSTNKSSLISPHSSNEDNNLTIRKNFRETLLFKPQLYPDKNGEINIGFNTSHLLSTFKVLMMVHDKSLNSTTLEDEFTVSKELMIQSNVPSFVREGDSLVVSGVAVNLSKDSLKTRCEAYADGILKGRSGEDKIGTKELLLAPGEQRGVEWKIFIPEGVTDSLKVKILLISDSYSDGEENVVKVLPVRSATARSEVHPIEKQGRYNYKITKDSEVKISAPSEILTDELMLMKSPASKNLFSWLGALYAKSYFGDSDLESFRKEAFLLFDNLYDKEGFFCWFPGMNGIYYLSYLFLEKVHEIANVGKFAFSVQENALLKRAVKSIDDHFLYQHSLSLQRKESYGSEVVPLFYAMYLRVRSLYPQFEMPNGLKDTITLYLNRFENHDVKNTVMVNAHIAAALISWGRDESAAKYMNSIKEYTVKNRTTGYYFPNAVLPFVGMVNNEIASHSFLLNLFADTGDKEMVTGIARWILLQKENQYWGAGLWITDAVSALLRADKLSDIRFMSSSGERSEVSQDVKRRRVTIIKKSDYPEFVNIIHNSVLRDDQVESFGNGLSIERVFYKVVADKGGERLIEIKDGIALSPGDLVEVICRIKNSENRSYVTLSSPLPASLVALDERSGYFRYYYKELKGSSTEYYFNQLPEGDHVIQERFIVNNKGDFSTGVPVIKSLFAPVYRGNGVSTKL